jgi:hypothetical protein
VNGRSIKVRLSISASRQRRTRRTDLHNSQILYHCHADNLKVRENTPTISGEASPIVRLFSRLNTTRGQA